MILIKLGGSVITDKSRYRTFNRETVSRLCREIKQSGKKVIIVHGAGSFGHVLAKEHKINDGFIDKSQIPAVTQICYDVRELNSMVVKELNDNGIPSVSVPTGSTFMMDNRKLIINDPEVLKGFISKGIVPVMFGDVVLDRKLGFAICSGDQIMERLAEIFDIERVIFVSDIDGLYDSDPKENKNAKLIEHVNKKTLKTIESNSAVDDVTGGVKEKMNSMLRMCSEKRDCILVNGNAEGRLLSLLQGKKVICTKAEGD